MSENVFLKNKKPATLADYLSFTDGSRGNLGDELPVAVYRLLEYSLKEALLERLGKEMQVELFRDAGRRAGTFFAKSALDLTLDVDPFISHLQKRLQEMKIGVLRIESVDDNGRIYLTVSEDADCSACQYWERPCATMTRAFWPGCCPPTLAGPIQRWRSTAGPPETGCAGSG